MANIFKAKTLLGKTGIFSHEVIAPNLIYTTGDQTINGDKNFVDKLIAKTGFFGKDNFIYGDWSTIGNGEQNIIYSNYSIIGGGKYNSITGYNFTNESGDKYNSILCGINNSITGSLNIVIGGSGNSILGSGNLIGGGFQNLIIDETYGYENGGASLILAGSENYIKGKDSAIFGGSRNCIYEDGVDILQGSTIIAGERHKIYSSYATIIAGYRNVASGNYSVIGGGCDLCIIGSFNNGIFAGGNNCILGGSRSSIIGGGSENIIYDSFVGFIGGGVGNTIITEDNGTNPYYFQPRGGSSIVGGRFNKISGSFASILGGRDNIVSGDYGYILGGRNAAILENHSGAAILADGQNRFHSSYSPHSLTVDFASGIYFAQPNIYGNVNFINNLGVQETGIFNDLDLSNISEFQFSGTNISLVDGNINITNGTVYLTNRPMINGSGVALTGENIFLSRFNHDTSNMNNNIYYFSNLDNLGISTSPNERKMTFMQKCQARYGAWHTYATGREQDSTSLFSTGYFVNTTTNQRGLISNTIRHSANLNLFTYTGLITPPVNVNFGDQVQIEFRVPNYVTGMSGVHNTVDITFFY